jgi:PAS domain-containing protein
MLAEEIDFQQIFRVHPTAMALVTADLKFVDANDEFLEASGRSLDDLIGHDVFAEFPKLPADPGGDPKWTALEAALTSGRHEVLALTRYDLEDPDSPGVFRERYWSSAVTPVRNSRGEIEVLEFSTREVTPIINKFKELLDQPEGAATVA